MQHPTRIDDEPAGRKVKLLLVDDQPANLLALEAVLDDLGAVLVKAHSGEEALRRLHNDEFALVLLDVQMHGLDGFETAKLIRGREMTRHIPIIFLTAYDDNRLPVDKAYALGAVDYLVKPLVPVILRAKVAGFIELFEKTEEVKRQAEELRRREGRQFERKLAQENARLRESEARKAAVVQTALDAIITIDHEGTIVEFNPAAEKLFGYRRDEVLGKVMAELIVPPGLRHDQRQGMARYLATGEGAVVGRRVEMPAVRADGTELTVELAISRISTEGPPLFTGYLRDITERRRAEQRRNVRLAVTQSLAEAATIQAVAPCILQAVCEGLQWDTGAFWLLDRRDDVLRCLALWQPPLIHCDEFARVSRERTFAPGIGLPGRVWKSGRPAWVPDIAQDANFPRAAVAAAAGLHGAFACPVLLGTDVLGVMEFFSRQLREPDSDVQEMMATIGGQVGQFIERKRAQEAVRDSEQRFARFMHHLPGLAWIKDLQGRYVYANDAAIRVFRRPREEVYGKTDEELFPFQTAAQFKENDAKALASGTGVQVVETLQHEDGVRHHSVASKFPITGPDGSPALVGGMAVDITDRLRAEEELKAEARRKDEFLAMLAHELRNPLAPIRNALQIMKQPGAGVMVQMREMMERQVRHMTRLLDDLLDVSRISRGKIELRKQVIDVASLVSRTVEAVQPLMEERRHELTVVLPDSPIWVRGDPTRLDQVLTNLLNNAAKYTDPGGQIRLAVERVGAAVVVRLRDTGCGIAADMLPHIFDLFVQAERRLERSHAGVGIGLTLVRRLVELHGGTVEGHSAGVGRGSEFVVRLPVMTDEFAEVSKGKIAGGAAAVVSPRRVLVVDDNRDAADSLGVLLRLEGQDVQVAYDGPTAISLAQDFRPQMVLLDLGMPGMDGYEVARRLRQQPGESKPLLVALTGWGQEEDRRRTQASGFNHHLTKPVEPKVLNRLLAQAVD